MSKKKEELVDFLLSELKRAKIHKLEINENIEKKLEAAKKIDRDAGNDIRKFRKVFFWMAFCLTILFVLTAILVPIIIGICVKEIGPQLAGIISGSVMPILAIIGLWKVTAKQIFSKMFTHAANLK